MSYAIRLAGFGDLGSQAVYALGPAYGFKGVGTDKVVRLLVSHPRFSESRVNWAKGEVTQSTLTFEAGEDEGHGAPLRRWIWTARPSPVAQLSANLTNVATTVNVTLAPGRTILAGRFLYLNAEVLYVSSVAGLPTSVTVVRGVAGTTAVAHSVDRISNDPQLYPANKMVVGRRVEFCTHDPMADDLVVVWSGRLEALDRTSGNGSTSVLRARDDVWSIASGQLGEGRVLMRRTAIAKALGGAQVVIDRGTGNATTHRPNGRLALWHEEAVVCARVFGYPNDATGIFESEDDGAPYLYLLDSGPGVDLEDIDAGPVVREVLTADPALSCSMIRDAQIVPQLNAHPIYIALALITSSGTGSFTVGHNVGSNGDYDWLPAQWGANIDVARVDTDTFETLATGLLADVRALQFCIGDTDSPDDMRLPDVLRDLLYPCMTAVVPDATGKLSARPFLDPGPDNVAWTLGAIDVIRVEEQPWAGSELATDIVLQMSRKVGSDDYTAAPIRVSAALGVKAGAEIEIDARHYRADDWESMAVLRKFAELLAIILRDRIPIYTLQLHPHAPRLGVGTVGTVTLGVSGISGPIAGDGERGLVARRCIVTGATPPDPGTGIQEVELWDLGFLSGSDCTTSPAWEVISVTDDKNFSVSASAEAIAKFAGESIHLWSADGKKRSTDGASFASSFLSGGPNILDITLNNAWTASSSPVTPVIGDWVRIPDLAGAAGWLALQATLGFVTGDDALIGSTKHRCNAGF